MKQLEEAMETYWEEQERKCQQLARGINVYKEMQKAIQTLITDSITAIC